jgi:hypothetical protein
MGGENWALMVRAIDSLAGHAATKRLGFTEESFEEACAEEDYINAATAIDSIVFGDEEHAALLGKAVNAAELIVEMAWPAIEMVAEQLLEKDSLSGEEVQEFVRNPYGLS